MPEEDDIQFIDAEDYGSYKQSQQFNHQALVMEIMRRCIEAGSHEMRSGWFNEKADKQGNINRTYIEDTRNKFIESVKTAEMIMVCDYDSDAKTNIESIHTELITKKNELLSLQQQWYELLSQGEQQRAATLYGAVYKGIFNTNLGWMQMYIEYELEIYRKIFKELTLLTKRLKFYEVEGIIDDGRSRLSD